MSDQEVIGEDFASVEQPEVSPEVDASVDESQEPLEDDPVGAYLAKYGGDVNKALRAAANLTWKIGEQGKELGQLRALLSEDAGDEWSVDDGEPESAVFDWEQEQAWTPGGLSPDEIAFAEELQAEQAGQRQSQLEEILAQADPGLVEFVGSSALDEMLADPLYAPDARAVVGGTADQQALALARLYVAHHGRTAQQYGNALTEVARATAREAQIAADEAWVASSMPTAPAVEKDAAEAEADRMAEVFTRNASVWDGAKSWGRGGAN